MSYSRTQRSDAGEARTFGQTDILDKLLSNLNPFPTPTPLCIKGHILKPKLQGFLRVVHYSKVHTHFFNDVKCFQLSIDEDALKMMSEKFQHKQSTVQPLTFSLFRLVEKIIFNKDIR